MHLQSSLRHHSGPDSSGSRSLVGRDSTRYRSPHNMTSGPEYPSALTSPSRHTHAGETQAKRDTCPGNSCSRLLTLGGRSAIVL